MNELNRLAPNSLHALDIAYTLHPNCNARVLERDGSLIIQGGDGIHVIDDSGNRYIEGMGGLWSAALGFSEQRLVDAAYRQMQKLPFYHSFLHRTHPATIEYAAALVQIAPSNLSKVFFANSGSEANDTVIKLVRYYNNALGRTQKKKIIARDRAYHGITVGAGSLTGLPLNHQDFDLPIPGILHASCPHHYRMALPAESEEDFATRLATELEEMILREGPETVAAFIGEPVMGAGGVMLPPRTYWQKIQEVCRRYDVLVVVDEVITGFGRTGKMFGCETFGITPDVMILSKQITSSYQPLSAVLISDAIYQGVADNSDRLGTFAHGFTTGGHPVAMAVAHESLRIYEERGLVAHVAEVSLRFAERLNRLQDHPAVGNTRHVGLLGGVEFVSDKATKAVFDPSGAFGRYVGARAQEMGLIIRPIGDVVAFAPPLIITESQIDEMFDIFEKAVDLAHQQYLRTSGHMA